MLPLGSAGARQKEMATLESFIHEMSTSKKFGDLIESASLEKDFLDVVPKLSQIYDEPFGDSSSIPTYLISKFAQKNVKVVNPINRKAYFL
jgi:asparagine synthetase B (glutamine-hydrolysing)